MHCIKYALISILSLGYFNLNADNLSNSLGLSIIGGVITVAPAPTAQPPVQATASDQSPAASNNPPSDQAAPQS